MRFHAGKKTTAAPPLRAGPRPDRRGLSRCLVKVKRFQQRGQPVISVDTKKKELVGPYKNNGREWQRKGEPERVDVHDFPDPELGKLIPYGVFDMSRNEGWVSVGIDHDTAQFAVQAIGRWWHKMGAKRYPDAVPRRVFQRLHEAACYAA